MQPWGYNHLAMASPAWENILVRFNYNVDARYYAIHHAEVSDPSEPIEVTEQDVGTPRRELEEEVQDMPAVLKRKLSLNLKQILSREGCGVDFDTISDPFNIHGFNVDRKVFPKGNEFHIADYSPAVQNVINFGWTGQDLLNECYGLFPDSEPGAPGVLRFILCHSRENRKFRERAVYPPMPTFLCK